MKEKSGHLNLAVGPATMSHRRSFFGVPNRAWEALRTGALYVAIIVGAAPFLAPFVFMLSSSLKPKVEIFIVPIRWIPGRIVWSNYHDAMFGYMPFYRFMWNSTKVVVGCLLGDVLVCALVGYAFARLRAPGRHVLFLIVLSTMMLPAQVVLVPTYILFKYLNLLDTLWSLVLPNLLAGGAFYIFLFRQFFQTIHPELGDAAKIDGCGLFGIFSRVYLPLSRPALTTVAIFSFFGHWNGFLWPLILLDSEDKFTVALGLRLFQGMRTTEYHLQMAASVIALAPCLILFFVAQKYFIQGVVITGVKG